MTPSYEISFFSSRHHQPLETQLPSSLLCLFLFAGIFVLRNAHICAFFAWTRSEEDSLAVKLPERNNEKEEEAELSCA